MTVSSNAQRRYAPGTWRSRPTLSTLAQQMADVARGERIQELRKARRIVQDDMPHLLKEFNDGNHVISRRGYQLWEAGEGISWKRAKILAAFLDVPVEEVAERVEDKGATPDPFAVLNGASAEQLDRIEEKLDEILERLKRDEGESEEPPSTAAPRKPGPVPPPTRETTRQAPSRPKPRRKSS